MDVVEVSIVEDVLELDVEECIRLIFHVVLTTPARVGVDSTHSLIQEETVILTGHKVSGVGPSGTVILTQMTGTARPVPVRSLVVVPVGVP